MAKIKILIILSFFISLSEFSFSQNDNEKPKVLSVKTKILIKWNSENESKKDAYKRASKLAKQKAIDTFGTTLAIVRDTEIKNTNNGNKTKTNSDIRVLATSTSKGEIIEIKKKEFKDYIRKEKIDGKKIKVTYIECKLEAKVREIKNSKINIETFALNSDLIIKPVNNFKFNEDFFIFFRSAGSGYLNIYYDDGEYANRLLPYSEMPSRFENGVPVYADSSYIFFSEKNRYFDKNDFEIDEMKMLKGNKNIEYGHIYIIFSKQALNKPKLKENDEMSKIYKIQENYKISKSLTSSDFKKWRVENLSFRADMQIENIFVKITK